MISRFLLNVFTSVRLFWANKCAATAIEYALIAAGIALAIVATVFLVGGDLDTLYSGVQEELAGAAAGGGDGS